MKSPVGRNENEGVTYNPITLPTFLIWYLLYLKKFGKKPIGGREHEGGEMKGGELIFHYFKKWEKKMDEILEFSKELVTTLHLSTTGLLDGFILLLYLFYTIIYAINIIILIN